MCRLPETAGAGIIALDVAGVVAAKKSPAGTTDQRGEFVVGKRDMNAGVHPAHLLYRRNRRVSRRLNGEPRDRAARRAAQEKPRDGFVGTRAGLGLGIMSMCRTPGGGTIALDVAGVRATALPYSINTIPPHRPAGDALDAGQQLDLASPAAAAIVARALHVIAEQLIPPVKVSLDKEPVLSAPIASDPHEP